MLVVCAHPDDNILGAGGTIAKYSSEGKKVITVIASYGESGNPWLKENVILGHLVPAGTGFKAHHVAEMRMTEAMLGEGGTAATEQAEGEAEGE